MNKFLKITNIFFIIFILTSCAGLQTKRVSNTFAITILSPIIKINDVGFLHKSSNSLNLQIYSSGVNLANIKISDRICVSAVCYEKKEFNKIFFLNEHYDEFFKEILEREPIYDRQNLVTNECGFSQNLSKYSIQYEVCNNNISFNDAKNRIKIIIKELE
ncbi:putative lipoprotein [Campylobacter sp. RM16187]|nr:putative lipoprotein [Campylobacter sp. RM16187]